MMYNTFVKFLSTASNKELTSFYCRTVEWRRDDPANAWKAEVQALAMKALDERFPNVLGQSPEAWDMPWDPMPNQVWLLPTWNA